MKPDFIERRTPDERIVRLEVICEQNVENIHELTNSFKTHMHEDRIEHAELRESLINTNNGINVLSKSVDDLKQIVEGQQNSITSGSKFRTWITGVAAGVVGLAVVAWAIIKFAAPFVLGG